MFKDFYFGCNKDVVQQFCEKHLDKIKNYVKNINQILPMPVDDVNRFNQLDFNTNTLKNKSQLNDFFQNFYI
jgi:hypothetical protein